MSTLVLVVVTLAVAGAITYILMKKGTIADANNNNIPDAIEEKVEEAKVVVKKVKAKVEKAKEVVAEVKKVADKVTKPATKKATKFLGSICGLLFVGLITYGLWHQAIKSVMILEVSADTSNFPIWPWKLACPIGASLCVLTMIGQLFQQIFTSLALRERK